MRKWIYILKNNYSNMGTEGVCEKILTPETHENGIDYYVNEHLQNTIEALNLGVNQNIPETYHYEVNTDGSGRFQILLRMLEGCKQLSIDSPNIRLVEEVATMIIEKVVHGLDPEINPSRVGELIEYGNEDDYIAIQNDIMRFIREIPEHQ